MGVRLSSGQGRWLVAACVLGSGAVFLESTVVNVALPTIARDFKLGMAGVQWVLNAYLLTLSSLMLLGGALGDAYGRRRVFAIGLAAFALSSLACAFAPNLLALVGARVLQGAAGAILVPNSLALIEASFVPDDRAPAIGQWAGWAAISTSIGPFVGGWLVDALSWRWVFVSILPFALAAALLVLRHAPATKPADHPHVDYLGGALATAGLAGVIGALISGPTLGATDTRVIAAGAAGVLLLIAFVIVELRAKKPLLEFGLFRSRQFTGANLETLFVYAALNGMFFLLMLQLQNVLGYSALAAGAAFLPGNFIMLVLSPVAGRLSVRVGPRVLMTVGAIVAGIGMLMLSRIHPGSTYVRNLLPAFIVFSLGLATVVAPLTATVLAAAPVESTGVASAVNNAIARLAGLLAVAILPLLAGIGGLQQAAGATFSDGFRRAMIICAFLCLAGALTAFLTIRNPPRSALAPR